MTSQYHYSLFLVLLSNIFLIIPCINIIDFVKNPNMTFSEFYEYISNINNYDYLYSILKCFKILCFSFSGIYILSIIVSVIQEYYLSKRRYVQNIFFEYESFTQSNKIKVNGYLYYTAYLSQLYSTTMLLALLLIKINDLEVITYSYGIYFIIISLCLQNFDMIIKLIDDKSYYVPIYDNL